MRGLKCLKRRESHFLTAMIDPVNTSLFEKMLRQAENETPEEAERKDEQLTRALAVRPFAKLRLPAAGPWIDAAEPPDGSDMYLVRLEKRGGYFLTAVYNGENWFNPHQIPSLLYRVTHYAVINAPEK